MHRNRIEYDDDNKKIGHTHRTMFILFLIIPSQNFCVFYAQKKNHKYLDRGQWLESKCSADSILKRRDHERK